MARTRTTNSVQVGRLGTRLIAKRVRVGATVKSVLRAAEIRLKDNEEVRLNAEETQLSTKVNHNDVIMIVKNVEGGR